MKTLPLLFCALIPVLCSGQTNTNIAPVQTNLSAVKRPAPLSPPVRTNRPAMKLPAIAIAPAPVQAVKLEAIRIISIGRFNLCETDHGQIILEKIPDPTVQYIASREKRRADIKAFSERVDSNDRYAQRLDAVAMTGASGSVDYVNAVMAQRQRANLAAIDVSNQRKRLSAMLDELETFMQNDSAWTTVRAYNSGRQYAGSKIWNSVGIEAWFEAAKTDRK